MSSDSSQEQKPQEQAPDAVAQQHAELKAATHELQRYLSDDIAPLTAAEFFEELLPGSPEIAARVIADWVSGQLSRPGGGVLASDLVYHSLRKLYLLAEFELLPREQLLRYIQGASRYLVQACPVAERDDLKLRLSRLGEGESAATTSRAKYLHGAGGGGSQEGDGTGLGGGAGAAAGALAAAASKLGPVASSKLGPMASSTLGPVGSGAAPGPPPTAQQIEKGTRALSLLLDRLSAIKIPENAKLSDSPDVGSFAQLLTTAALDSQSETELGKNMEKIRGTGNAAPMGQVFRALGWNLPGWTSVGPAGEVVAPAGRSLEAMNKIVALAPDSQERAKRWGEMIYAAIEQLNEGRLAQTVSILEAAKSLIAQKHPDPTIVGQVLAQAEGAISEQVIRKLVDIPGKHALLRLVLDFFPGMRAGAILDELDGEPRRERRKLILALLEVHGESCRDAILDRLRAITAGERQDPLGYYGRNLAFLLRRIARKGHHRLEEELALLEKMIEKGQPGMSAKEAIGALGQMRERTAECALLDRLHEMETELARGGDQESWELLDRLCAALARHGSQQSIRAVAAHAFKRQPAFGDTMARLEHLGWIDLSVDPEQLSILLSTIRDLMPKKLLGFSMKRPPADLAPLVHAVSGTPSMEVRSVLEAVAHAMRNHPLGEQASKALAKLAPKATAPAASSETLSGDLELFGLAGLLQSLQGSESTGELTILDRQHAAVGSMGLSKGRITKCEAGKLTGMEAAYLLFEKPVPGTFSFRSTTAVQTPRDARNRVFDPMEVILEGARRHDEYKRACAIAPDGLRLEPAGIAAVRPEDEESPDLASDVWDRASKGLTPDACEHEIAIDPFRVRRLYAWWIEQGALRARTA
jgi:uncharacterized protein DUF4388